jgi:hypothetical protein
MNDEWLYQWQQSPRPQFAAELRAKLPSATRAPRRRGWLKAAAALILVWVGVWLISPEVRAYVQEKVAEILYLHFGQVQLNVITANKISSSGGNWLSDDHQEIRTIAAAQEILPFQVPALLTERYPTVDTVHITYYDRWMTHFNIYYPSQTAWEVLFGVINDPQPEIVVGNDHQAQSVNINGNLGTLYQGNWNDSAGGKSFGGEVWNLVWTVADKTYWLSSEKLTGAELLAIAASLP